MNYLAAGTVRRRAFVRVRQRGFSLIEIALVLVIVGLALGGIMSALGPQLENRKVGETQERIKQASEAIMAFAMVNRRLPCPATAASAGIEVVSAGPAGTRGECANPNGGFVPARTLGLGEQGPDGLMQDAWGFGIRYAVDQRMYIGSGHDPATTKKDCSVAAAPCYPFTQVDGLKSAYYKDGSPTAVPADHFSPSFADTTGIPPGHLEVCTTVTGSTATDCGTAVRLAQAGFVIWSTARNGAELPGGGGLDEAANLDNNPVYVSHPRSEAGVTNGAFDDIFLWQPTSVIQSRLVNAGVLP